MKKTGLSILFLFIGIHTITSQNTLELIALDHNRQNNSLTHISEINFRVITQHKTIPLDSTMFFPIPFKFETTENKVKIEYENIFNQTLDTTFIINSKNQKIYLIVDRIKDYDVKTFLETSLSENKKWTLEFSGGSCFITTNTKLQIIPNKKGAVLKYKSSERWSESGKKIKEEKTVELNSNDISNLISFEKKLRLLNSARSRCGPGTFYYLTLGNNKLIAKDETCSGIYQDYLKEIIERNN